MKRASGYRLTVLLATGCATACAAVSLVFGYGWSATAVTIFTGIGVGYWAARKFLVKRNLPTDTSFYSLATLNSKHPRFNHKRRGMLSSHDNSLDISQSNSRVASVLIGLFRPLPKYQRWASVIFLLQAGVSLFAIFGAWVAQKLGLDIRIVHVPSLESVFANTFPIEASAVLARMRFDYVFLPLVSLYIVSLTMFTVALIHSLGSLVRALNKHLTLLLGIAFFLAGLLLLFAGGSSGGSLRNYIVEGNLWGYIVLFVFFPIVGVFLASELPSDR